jgi:hypothetical protein
MLLHEKPITDSMPPPLSDRAKAGSHFCEAILRGYYG